MDQFCEIAVWPISFNFIFFRSVLQVYFIACMVLADVNIFSTFLGLKSHTLRPSSCLYSVLAAKISLYSLGPS